MNSYIPEAPEKRKYEWYEHNLRSYIDNLKHKGFIENMLAYFSHAKIIHFDLIHHYCWGDELKNHKKYHKTIQKHDFKNYEHDVRNQAVSSAIKSERDNVRFERHLLKSHIQQDGFFVILARRRKLHIRQDFISNVCGGKSRKCATENY